MSFEEAWVLPKVVSNYADADLVSRVRDLFPPKAGIQVRISGELSCRSIRVDVPLAEVEAVADKLAARPGELDWDWRAEMDPPDDEDDDVYALYIDIVDDDYPLIRIYSNEGSNRAAWPLLFSIASSLADELGAIPEEDAPPRSDHIPMFIEPGKPKPN